MSDYEIRSTCRLCASPDLERLLTLPDTPLANEYPKDVPNPFPLVPALGRAFTQQDRFPLYLVGCSACGHVQLPVVVDPELLFPPTYPYQSGTSPVFREHLVKLAATLAGMLEPGAGVYDIACNDGTFVDELRQQGLEAYGVDPAAPIDDPALHRAFFTEGWARNHRDGHDPGTDCITALNVFAHVDDLDDFTRGVRTLLEPCGLFVVECGYLSDVVKGGFFDVAYHEHLAIHHLSPLVRFFRKHGMTLVDAHRIDSQGGSFRAYIRNCSTQHAGGDDGHNLQTTRLQDLLDEESRSQLWDGVRDMGNVRAGWGVRGVRDRIKAKAPLVVYGAPAKLTTLLHATDTVDCIEWVADDNPLKVGKYVPGTRIPIRPVSELYEKRPKRVMLASWNFSGEIRQRHAELGCEWVMPYG